MKYGEATMGQKAAKLLKFVCEVAVGGTKRFVAADAFGENNTDGIKFYLWPNFANNFLGKVEEDVEAAIIRVHKLEKTSRDPDIMAELDVEKLVIKLAHFYEMLKSQGQGQDGLLLVYGYANIAYIEDENRTVWAVDALWLVGGWSVDAHSVEDPYEWIQGFRVLSR